MNDEIAKAGKSGSMVDPLMESAASAPVMSDSDFQEMRAFYEKAAHKHCGPELASADLQID